MRVWRSIVQSGWAWCPALVVICLFLCVWPCGHVHTWVCTECGMIRKTREYHVPFTEVEMFTTEETRPTLLSEFVSRHDLLGEHVHPWMLQSGGGFGIGKRMCELGRGMYLYSSVADERMIPPLESIAKRLGPEKARKWVGFLLSVDYCEDVQSAFYMWDPDTYDVAGWLAEKREYINDHRTYDGEPPLP